MYYSAIGLLGALILLIENQDILFRRSGAFETPAWNAYRRFLITILVYDVTDILWGILKSRKMAQLMFADTTAYYVAMAIGILCWTQYIVTFLEEKNRFGVLLLYAGRIMAGLVIILACINPFTPVLFTVSEACDYVALRPRYVMLTAQIILLLLISVYAITGYFRRHMNERVKYRTLILFGLIMAAFLLAQLYFPLLPLYAIAYMLGSSLLHAFVVGDEKEGYRLRLEEADRVRELKQSISSLLDNMPALSFSKDAQTGVYMACNQAFAEYAHKETPDGVIGLTDAQIFDPVTAEHFVEDDRMALSMEEPYIFFEDVADAAGNPRQFQTTKLKFIDAAGRLCTLGMSQDVTDLVRIQRENSTTKEAYEQARRKGIMYSHIAQALARSYTDLYYVNLETEAFIEYRTDTEHNTLQEARRGVNFFDSCEAEAKIYVYPEDRQAFVAAMNRDTLKAALNRDKVFIMTYRLMDDAGPRYVSMKVSRMEDDDNFIIIGVTDVDEQTKQRRRAERMEEERIAVTRLNALLGDVVSVCIIVPETGRYREYSATAGYESLSFPKEGTDFFGIVRSKAPDFVFSEDLDRFLSLFTREDVQEEISRSGMFAMSCRFMLGARLLHGQIKAAMIEEADGPRMIIGIIDADSFVRLEEDYKQRLAAAQNEANVDVLTGVKNRHAYLEVEEQMDLRIQERRLSDFAIAILDVNDLKKVNDTAGHKAGDQYLCAACRIICDLFSHSVVYRVGGDEFAVIVQDEDYAHLDELTEKMQVRNELAARSDGIVIACGAARYENDSCVAVVFERADQRMYDNKNSLKSRFAADKKVQ